MRVRQNYCFLVNLKEVLSNLQNVGVLLDLDGVIYQGSSLIPGAVETIHILQHNNIPFRFITNTARMTKKNLVSKLHSMGLSIEINEVFAAPHAAVEYCKGREYTAIDLVVPDKEMKEDFSDFSLNVESPQAVVLGDMGHGFTFGLLNSLFKKILNGAELVAMHKNKHWHSGSELTLDLGAFVSALEFVSEKEAVLIGKPSPYLFQLAAQSWGIPFQSIYMVGDDMVADVGGANNVGMKSVLVKTGKFRKEWLSHPGGKPNHIINSIADLPSLLQLY